MKHFARVTRLDRATNLAAFDALVAQERRVRRKLSEPEIDQVLAEYGLAVRVRLRFVVALVLVAAWWLAGRVG